MKSKERSVLGNTSKAKRTFVKNVKGEVLEIAGGRLIYYREGLEFSSVRYPKWIFGTIKLSALKEAVKNKDLYVQLDLMSDGKIIKLNLVKIDFCTRWRRIGCCEFTERAFNKIMKAAGVKQDW